MWCKCLHLSTEVSEITFVCKLRKSQIHVYVVMYEHICTYLIIFPLSWVVLMWGKLGHQSKTVSRNYLWSCVDSNRSYHHILPQHRYDMAEVLLLQKHSSHQEALYFLTLKYSKKLCETFHLDYKKWSVSSSQFLQINLLNSITLPTFESRTLPKENKPLLIIHQWLSSKVKWFK